MVATEELARRVEELQGLKKYDFGKINEIYFRHSVKLR